jgi:O-antigen ligase
MGSYFFIDNISVRSPSALRHISLGKKILIASSIVIFFFGFQYLYQNVISRSTEDIKAKEKSQAAGDYGLFLGGRTEIISSFYAIRDSPILGHGSWAKNPYYDQMMYYFLRDAGYQPGKNVSELIPTHSHFWGAWVESGILGAIFWGYIFFLAFKVPLKLYKIKEPIKYVTLFVVFTLIWDILFSPYGADRRLSQPFFIVVIITVLDNIKYQTQLNMNQFSDAN